MRWLELASGYACNCACVGCHSCSAAPEAQMSSLEILRRLQEARRAGAKFLWLSGGEPTLRRDFLPTIRAAKQLGFERIKVQTNGLLFSYRDLVDKAIAAGMTEVNFLLRTTKAEVHDELHRRPGAFLLLEQAIANFADRGVRLEGDVLVTTPTVADLPDVVAHYAARGLVQFNVWLFSTSDQGAADLRALVPKLSALRDPLRNALKAARSRNVSLVSLHTPHCLVEPAEWSLQFDPAAMGLYVVNPGGHAFMLDESPIEKGTYVAACDGCAARGPCRGLRPDYVAIHGTSDARTVTADEASRGDLRPSRLDLPPAA